MTRWTFRTIAAGLVLAAAGGTVAGWDLMKGLWGTAEDKVRQATRQYVDDKVLLEQAIAKAEAELPRAKAELQTAISENQQAAESARSDNQETSRAIAMVEADLRTLAPAVTQNRGATVRGRTLDAAAAADEAKRLLATRKRYEQELSARKALLDKLVQQQAELTDKLAAIDTSMRNFATQASELQSKIALVKCYEQMQQQSSRTHVKTEAAALAPLDREIEKKLLEHAARQEMRDSQAAGDATKTEVQRQDVRDQLQQFVAGATPTTREDGR